MNNRTFVSTSAQKIQITESTKAILDEIRGYETDFRGYLEVKVSFSEALLVTKPVNSLLCLLNAFFEITGYPCNLIGSHRCDLSPNRTIFCCKSHLFLSQ